MSQLSEALAALNTARGRSDSIVVSYSGGKDSLVVMDMCVRTFPKVEAFMMEFVPGLPMNQERIDYAKSKWGVSVKRYPDPGAVDSSSTEASAAAEEAAEGAREEMKKYDEAIAKARERDSDDFYMCVIFRSYADRKAFTAAHGLEDNRYQSADDIAALLLVSEPRKVPDAELPSDRNRRPKRARPAQLKGKAPSTEIAPSAERPNL